MILALGRRLPLTRGHRLRSVPVLVVAGILVTCFKIVARALVGQLIPAIPTMRIRGMMLSQFHLNLATFWVILGIGAAFDYYRKFRERELRATQLESRLAQAQLDVLRMQLQPHFLFNTLHTISAYMQEGDIEAADHMIARLSELLRLAIDGVHTQEVPLRRELEFVQRYLDIQQIRFNEQLRVRVDVAPDVLDAMVPSLLLQPLVENAIRHGISPRAEGGTVALRIARAGPELHIDIEDDGVGLEAAASRGVGKGVGLANTRARLTQLHGTAQRFDVRDRPEGGVRVSLALPFVLAD
jgi:sensor histidine kinase YesM